MKRKTQRSELQREFNYASHHHLIPLYILSGIIIVTLLVIGSFVAALWHQNQQEVFRSGAALAVQAHKDIYLPAVLSPTDKKQYIYSANIRFAAGDPYSALRYEYIPASTFAKTGTMVTLTTSRTIQDLETPITNNPTKAWDYIPRLQQCTRLYVIRFEPGVTSYGGFAFVKDVKLRDGRTAYIHKNINCVPNSTTTMNTLEELEKNILSIESY